MTPLTKHIDALVTAIATLTPAAASDLAAFRSALDSLLTAVLETTTNLASGAVVPLIDRVRALETWQHKHEEWHARDNEELIARLGGAFQAQALMKRIDELETMMQELRHDRDA